MPDIMRSHASVAERPNFSMRTFTPLRLSATSEPKTLSMVSTEVITVDRSCPLCSPSTSRAFTAVSVSPSMESPQPSAYRSRSVEDICSA